MKKLYRHNEMSNVKCIVCGKLIKMNVIAKQPDANRCYKHELNPSGHMKQAR